MNGWRGRRLSERHDLERYPGVCTKYAAIPIVLAVLMGDLKVAPTLVAEAASTGKAAGAILKVGMGARPAALGEAYGALGDDVYAAAYNPAGLGAVRQTQVGVQHLVWLEQTAAEYAAFTCPLKGGRHAVGAAILLFRPGDFVRAFGDAAGDFDAAKSQGTFTANNFVGTVSYAYTAGGQETALTRRVRFGIAGKLVRDVVDDQAVQTVGVDVGVQAQPSGAFPVGASAVNLGGKIEADELPGAVRAGVAYVGLKRLKVPVEVVIPLDESRVKVGGGAEVQVLEGVALRGGVRTGAPVVSSGGLGVSWRGLSVDYAFAWYARALRDAHRISLTYRFGSIP